MEETLAFDKILITLELTESYVGLDRVVYAEWHEEVSVPFSFH